MGRGAGRWGGGRILKKRGYTGRLRPNGVALFTSYYSVRKGSGIKKIVFTGKDE